MIRLPGRGTARSEDAQGTPTQSHMSQVYKYTKIIKGVSRSRWSLMFPVICLMSEMEDRRTCINFNFSSLSLSFSLSLSLSLSLSISIYIYIYIYIYVCV